MRLRHLLFGLGLLATAALAKPALSQPAKDTAAAKKAGAVETITLKLVSSAPTTSLAAVSLTAILQPEVSRRLKADGGKISAAWQIKKQLANAPQIFGGREAFFDISSAVADMGLIDLAAESEDLPLLLAPWQAPFLQLDPPKLVRILSAVIDQSPEIRQSFLAKDQVLLAITATSELVLVSKMPLASLPALEGKKIGLAPLAAKWLQNTGAIAVSSAPRTYSASLKSGKLDGVIVPAAWVAPLKLLEAAKQVTRAGLGVMPAEALTINKSRWDGLEPAVRDALYSAARDYQQKLAAAEAARSAQIFSKLVAGGAKVSNMALADRKAWAAALPALAKQWPAALKKSGKPAQPVMSGFLAEVQKYDPNPVRDWAR